MFFKMRAYCRRYSTGIFDDQDKETVVFQNPTETDFAEVFQKKMTPHALSQLNSGLHGNNATTFVAMVTEYAFALGESW